MMGEALAGFFEQEMHVARRDAEQKRDRNCTQARIAAAAIDLTQNGAKERGATATLLRLVAHVTPPTEKQRNEIVDVRDDEIAIRRVRQLAKAKCTNIAHQQGQTLDIAGDPPCIPGIEIDDPC